MCLCETSYDQNKVIPQIVAHDLGYLCIFFSQPDACNSMELEGQWWKGQLAGDIHQALRLKVFKHN